MTWPIEGWSILETVLIENSVQYQTPLIGGRHRISEKVVQNDLGFVGGEADLKEIGAHMIEFEALAFVQGPVDMDQVNRRDKSIRTNMMKFSPSVGYFSSSLAFVTSLRTRTPERKESVHNEIREEISYKASPRGQWILLGCL